MANTRTKKYEKLKQTTTDLFVFFGAARSFISRINKSEGERHILQRIKECKCIYVFTVNTIDRHICVCVCVWGWRVNTLVDVIFYG